MYGLIYDFRAFYITYAIVKTIFFAFIISSVSAYFGYHTKGGAIAVGKSSTTAVVSSSILILLFNYLLTDIILS
jgi:phospholipid/cholesterol/gamma-HCH transport system permease protein